MARPWEADPSALLSRRLGKPAHELKLPGENNSPVSSGRTGCPDIWELDNGDIAVIGRDLTSSYRPNLPADVILADDERLVIIPRVTLIAAKADIPDA